MRQVVFLLLLSLWRAFFLPLAFAQNETTKSVVVGHILNPLATRDVMFSFTDNPLLESEEQTITELQSDNYFYFTQAVQTMNFVHLQYGGETMDFLLEPSEQLNVTFNAIDPLKTLQFSGEKSAKNQYLHNFQQKYNETSNRMYFSNDYFLYYGSFDLLTQANTLPTLMEGKTFIAAQRQRQLKELEDFKQQKPLSAAFYQWALDAINYSYAANMLCFLKMNKEIIVLDPAAAPSALYDFFEEAPLKDISVNNPYYLNFVAAYLDYHHEYRNGKTPDEIDLFYNALSRVLQGATKDYFQARYIIKSLKNKNLDLYNHYFSTFIAENKNPTFAQAVQMVHQHNVRFMNGALAPEIDAHRDNGSDLQLSDFRGKVLYVSFWASWCKPCIENMINTKSLKESLAKKGVVFVNVSMDRDDATWRSSLQKLSPLGINAISDNIAAANADYGFTTLPAYFIIDRYGSFQNSSDSGLENAQNTLLKLLQE